MEYRETHPWITFELDLRNAPARFWMLLGEACAKCEHIAGVPLTPDTADRLNRVFLERGAQATTAIEGNTLSLEEVSELARGELRLPPSKEYLGVEVRNILDTFDDMAKDLASGRTPALDTERVKYLNRRVLDGLELDDGVTPGEIRSYEVGVGRYKGAPASDCRYLLDRLCEWLNGMDFELGRSELAPAILKAVVAHLYLAWIHPFGDGNGRVARLVEYQILLSAGVPDPATHLLSNHYNETRSEYYRRLDRSGRTPNGVVEFLAYALQGFVDGLEDQIRVIMERARKDIWTNYVHSRFSDLSGPANARRLRLVLDLSDFGGPVARRDIRLLTPALAEAYHGKTEKTITRDLNALARMGLINRGEQGIISGEDSILAFLPRTQRPETTS